MQYNSVKKHYRPALLAFIAALFLIVLYFAAVRPLMNGGGEDTPPAVTTAPGEGIQYDLGTLYPGIKRTDMTVIRVHNEEGTYEFRRMSVKEGEEIDPTSPFIIFQEEAVGKDENGNTKYAMVGYPDVAYNEERFSELVVATGTFYYLRNLTGDAAAEGAALDYSRYGLAPEDDPAWFEIETFGADKPIRVYVGDPAVTDSGYYVRVEGRDAVYVSNSTLVGKTALKNIESYVDAMLTYPLVSNGYYFNKDFTLWKQSGDDYKIGIQDTVSFLFDTYENGVLKHADEYATVDLIRAKEALRNAFAGRTKDATDIVYEITFDDEEADEELRGKTVEYRVKKILSVNSLYITLNFVKTSERSKFHAGVAYAITAPESKIAYQPNTNNYMGILEKIGYMTGTETVAVGLSQETMERFGLGYYTVYFEAPKELSYDTAEGKKDDVLIGATERYYLYISEKQEDGTYYVGSEQTNVVARVDGELLAFLERGEAWWLKDTMYTVNINEAVKLEYEFSFSDVKKKYELVLSHDSADGKNKSLISVMYAGENRSLSIDGFRNLYMHLLTCYYTGEYDGEQEKAELMADKSRCALTLRVTLSDGEVYVYRYYPYSARHVLVSIAKEGEDEGAYFYILSSELEKIYRDVETLLSGGIPDPEKQY